MERVTVTAAVNIVIVCQMTVKGCVKISVLQLGHSTGTVTWVRAALRAGVARAGSLSPNIRLCVFSVALSLDRYIHFSFRPIIITKKHHGYVRSEADWGLYDHLPGHPEEQEAPLRCLRHQGGADRCGNCKLTSTFETPTSTKTKKIESIIQGWCTRQFLCRVPGWPPQEGGWGRGLQIRPLWLRVHFQSWWHRVNLQIQTVPDELVPGWRQDQEENALLVEVTISHRDVMQLVIYHYYSFDTLKRAFVGVHKVIQANDKSECEQVIIIVRHNPQSVFVSEFRWNLIFNPYFRVQLKRFSGQLTEFKVLAAKVVISSSYNIMH